jgi:hypothetical protein
VIPGAHDTRICPKIDRRPPVAGQLAYGAQPDGSAAILGPVPIRRRHVLHSSVAIVVLVQLGFASALLFDAAGTNRSYDALQASHVALTGQVRGCAFVPRGSRGGYVGSSGRVCRVGYTYRGQTFSEYIAAGRSTVVFVDPQDSSIRMTKVDFDGGPEATTTDVVIAALLILGAIAVSTVHLAHIRRRQRRHQGPLPDRRAGRD